MRQIVLKLSPLQTKENSDFQMSTSSERHVIYVIYENLFVVVPRSQMHLRILFKVKIFLLEINHTVGLRLVSHKERLSRSIEK